METTEKKRTGNPNFGKKPVIIGWDPSKRYQFKLTQSHEKAKPRDKDTGEILDNPYPPIYIGLNSGVGVNPKTKEIENWRYVFGYSSIWVKEQQKPEPSKQQLENPRNDIVFRNGSLFVQGNNTALLDALTIQDIYDEVKSPVNITPSVFTLVNDDKVRDSLRTSADLAFEAEKAAREATFEEMIPVAQAFGINCDNPEENEDRIRTEFILKSKQVPAEFTRQMVNPKNVYKYNITQALRQHVISTDVVPGKIVLVDTGKAYFDIREGVDVADYFATLYIQRDNDAMALYDHLEKILSAPVQAQQE
jgi:hypothetical protein